MRRIFALTGLALVLTTGTALAQDAPAMSEAAPDAAVTAEAPQIKAKFLKVGRPAAPAPAAVEAAPEAQVAEGEAPAEELLDMSALLVDGGVEEPVGEEIIASLRRIDG